MVDIPDTYGYRLLFFLPKFELRNEGILWGGTLYLWGDFIKIMIRERVIPRARPFIYFVDYDAQMELITRDKRLVISGFITRRGAPRGEPRGKSYTYEYLKDEIRKNVTCPIEKEDYKWKNFLGDLVLTLVMITTSLIVIILLALWFLR